MVSVATGSAGTDGRSRWPAAVAGIAAYWLAVLWLFRDTALGMEAIWARSDTFAHGYLILPICCWLVYRQREALRQAQPAPGLWGLAWMLPAAALWLAGYLVDINVAQQLALVGLLVAGSWAIVGNSVARLIAFPLGYLFLAVPMGEALIPPLQEFTAFATVRLVELSGVPVFRDGMLFSLPTGNWRVVEACSGVRYLIASFTLGVLYAYLNYTHWRKRLLFALVSLVLPIAANAVRAYLIVMLGHLSSGELAAGVDHLIYGWVFFGVVMLLLFWVGSFWSDDPHSANAPQPAPQAPGSAWALAGVTLAAIALAWSPWWLLAGRYEAQGHSSTPPALAHQQRTADWPWVARSEGASRLTRSVNNLDGTPVFLDIQQFPPQPGVEAAVRFRELNPVPDEWEVRRLRARELVLADDTVTVMEVILKAKSQAQGQEQRLRIWYWFRVGNTNTASPAEVKLLELWQRLKPHGQGTERVILATADDEQGSAAAVLERFVAAQGATLLGGG
ncbi:exosortase A [Parahaliea mediterranea]|uniref:exosortase A n=1 Tax=Parahaliea mediterranea TaxID=651086 RepID=UPI00147619CB|nr:exosortase A [Parahaliea mediterranea]